MFTRSRPAANESSDSRYGVPLVYNKYTYKRRPQPPVLTLDELRREYERVIAPLLRTDSQSK